MINNDEMSASEIIEAIGDLTGITLQIHKNFKPIFVTEDYARLYGFDSVADFMALDSIMALIPEDIHQLALERYEEVISTGKAPELSLKSQRIDGSQLWVRLQDRRIHYKGEYCVMTVLIDITDEIEVKEAYQKSAKAELKARRELEALQGMVIEREKQAALNYLLIGVSHQLNTPLGNILSSASVADGVIKNTLTELNNKTLKLSTLNDAMTDLQAATQLIEAGGQRATKLIKNVKFMVSDKAETEKVDFHFGPIIRDTVKIVTSEATHLDLRISIEIKKGIHSHANPNVWMQLMSVFCENALYHGFKDRTEGEIRIHADLTDQAFILVFEDNGCGIPTQRHDRIFDAFYSTQLSSQTGLGLALAYNLVSRTLKGKLRLLPNDSNGGAAFQITLPAADFFIIEF